jgi:hypothetical protein
MNYAPTGQKDPFLPGFHGNLQTTVHSLDPNPGAYPGIISWADIMDIREAWRWEKPPSSLRSDAIKRK